MSAPPSPRDINNGDTAKNLVQHIENLRGEVTGLKSQLRAAQIERKGVYLLLSVDITSGA